MDFSDLAKGEDVIGVKCQGCGRETIINKVYYSVIGNLGLKQCSGCRNGGASGSSQSNQTD